MPPARRIRHSCPNKVKQEPERQNGNDGGNVRGQANLTLSSSNYSHEQQGPAQKLEGRDLIRGTSGPSADKQKAGTKPVYRPEQWVFDNGATQHLVGDKPTFVDGLPFVLRIDNVYYSPEKTNLFSQSVTTEQGFQIVYNDSTLEYTLSMNGEVAMQIKVHPCKLWIFNAENSFLSEKEQTADRPTPQIMVQELLTDGGGEFVNGGMIAWYQEHGISHTPTPPNTPRLNMVERTHQTLTGMLKAMMKDSGFPTSFWVEALHYAVYIRNRTFSSATNSTPIGFVLGYRDGILGCKIYFPSEGTVEVAGQVTVNEQIMYKDRHNDGFDRRVRDLALAEHPDLTSTGRRDYDLPVAGREDEDASTNIGVHDSIAAARSSCTPTAGYDTVPSGDVSSRSTIGAEVATYSDYEQDHHTGLVAANLQHSDTNTRPKNCTSEASQRRGKLAEVLEINDDDIGLNEMQVYAALAAIAMLKDRTVATVLVYVDDIICASNKECWKTQFFAELNQKYGLKDMGRLNNYLGVQVDWQDDGVLLHQSKYAQEILERFGFVDAIQGRSPMDTTVKLGAAKEGDKEPGLPYREAIGALMYLATSTRPDLAFSVGCLSRFVQHPNISHAATLKRILRYLAATKNHGIFFKNQDPVVSKVLEINGFVDADWGNCPDTRKSVSGLVLLEDVPEMARAYEEQYALAQQK
ncbi:hypothetical protein ON010_g9857 [Phytophthora cinnamomi]|nr:hypothetical protein ON010_g9857 [Phytophthora cinnamomi]